MNLLAGVGNELLFLPTAGKRAAINVTYTPGLLGWTVQGPATPGQADQWSGLGYTEAKSVHAMTCCSERVICYQKALCYTKMGTYSELAVGVRCPKLGLKQARRLSDTTETLEHGIYMGACLTSQAETTKSLRVFAKRNNIKPVNTGVHAVCTTLRTSAADGYLQC